MNLILLFPGDFIDLDRVRLTGRRFKHVQEVHRAAAGDALTVGMAGGNIGRGIITLLDRQLLEMTVTFDTPPPSPLGITLILALPRPKVLNRVLAGAASMGVKRIVLVNAWRVEKSYWSSPRLSEENLREQSILGLEQARDTTLPRIETRRLFRPFVEDELPSIAAGTTALVAHPYDAAPLPRDVAGEVTLAIGPEGGFIEKEIASLEAAGLQRISSGPRIVRVETAVPLLIAALKRVV